MHTIKDISDINALYRAFQKCKRKVAWKESVQAFELNLLRNLTQLQKELENGAYRQRPYLEFDICERGKKRRIRANTIRDRVVYTALVDEVIMPSISKYLIYDNGASIKGKGLTFTEDRLRHHLHAYYRRYGAEGYALKIDFAKYFDNIDHEQARELLRKYINCDAALWQVINDTIDEFSLFVNDETAKQPILDTLTCHNGDIKLCKSVAIGNPIAQAIGILYLAPIDNYCKIVKGLPYYGRYMDDIYILHRDKSFLQGLITEIKSLCIKHKLSLNTSKTQIYSLSKGFTFLHKRVSISGTGRVYSRVDRGTIQRIKRRLRKQSAFLSYAELETNYRAWRGNMLKRYDCALKVKHTDMYYRGLKAVMKI